MNPICYADTVDEYKDNCTGKYSDSENKTNWIVVNNFSVIYSNVILKESQQNTSRIEGLIFIADHHIHSLFTFLRPKIISMGSLEQNTQESKEYAFNY